MLSCHHQYLSGQLMINSSSSLCVKNQTFLFASSPSMPTAIFKCGLKVIMWQRRRTDVLKLSHTHSPTQIFQNALCVVCWHKQMSVQSSQSTSSPGFSPKRGKEVDFTVSSMSVINLWPCISMGSCSGGPALWCFLGSSWVVWGQKMCALKSRCYRYCQIDL